MFFYLYTYVILLFRVNTSNSPTDLGWPGGTGLGPGNVLLLKVSGPILPVPILMGYFSFLKKKNTSNSPCNFGVV